MLLDSVEKLHVIDRQTQEELETIEISEVQLVYNSSHFKSLATGGNVSEALVDTNDLLVLANCFRYALSGGVWSFGKKCFLKHLKNHTWCWCGQLTVYVSFRALLFWGAAFKLPGFAVLCTGRNLMCFIIQEIPIDFSTWGNCMPQILCHSSACALLWHTRSLPFSHRLSCRGR